MSKVDTLIEAVKNNAISTVTFGISSSLSSQSLIDKLAEALKVNTSLLELNCSRNNISIVGAIALAEALKVNTSLQQLHCDYNNIGNGGATALAETLKFNTSLQQLDCRLNGIGTAGAIALAEALKINRVLLQLDCGSNDIGAAGAMALAEVLKLNASLQQLNCCASNIGAAGAMALAEALKSNRVLLQLNCSFNKIDTAGATALAEALKVNTSLQQLNYGSNKIGSAGAIALAEALKLNTSLQQLDCHSNKIGDAGAMALAEALKLNTSLLQLNCGSNKIGDAGATALAEALKINTSLQQLDCRDNNMGTAGVMAFEQMLANNYTLCGLEGVYTPEIEKYLKRNQGIREVLKLFDDFENQDLDALEDAIQRLVTLVPALSSEDTDELPSYICEAHRLLYARAYILDENPLQALTCLEAPFQHQPFANLAKLYTTDMLMILDSKTMTNEEKIAYYRWLAYQTKEDTQSPLYKLAILGLQLPSESPDPTQASSFEDITGADQLITFEDVLVLGKKALLSIGTEQQQEDEKELLTLLLQESEYDPLTVDFFWHCPSFQAQLRHAYPDVATFRVLENYLHYPAPTESRRRILQPLLNLVPIEHRLIHNYKSVRATEELAPNTPKSFSEILQQSKETICHLHLNQESHRLNSPK